MENSSHHQSYPDSGHSSPLSSENPSSSWDEPPPPPKLKFMCSYGGQIQPRSHDNSLSYVGGDTKILSLERTSTFSSVLAKLASICNASDIRIKYQLPGEDLDALISLTNDEDLEHLMLEYDRLNRNSQKPTKLRIFLFSVNSKANSEENSKADGSWFVDALNSVQYQTFDDSSPPLQKIPEPSNPDFLFGFDKAVADPNPNPADSIQSQMEAFQIGEAEMQKSHVEMYQSEYYMVQEKSPPAPQAAPVPMSVGYWPERQQPVYVMQNPNGGVYHQNPSMQPVTGQPYYNIPQQPAYNAVPLPSSSLIQQRQQPAMATEQGYTQVSYVDGSGRPVYYTVAGGGLAPPMQYQMVTNAVVDGKVVGGNAPQTSSV